jgi:hypothetical protein
MEIKKYEIMLETLGIEKSILKTLKLFFFEDEF